MASINTQINIVDRMTSPLNNISSAIGGVISSLQGVDNAIVQGFDTSTIDNARRSIDLANRELEEITHTVNQNTTEQNRFNNSVNRGTNATDRLSSSLTSIVSAYAIFQGVKKMTALSDTMSQVTARLNLMNDGMQTTKELQDQIYLSAQRSRVGYVEMANVISKIGTSAKDAFSSNEEVIAFAENLSKSFVTFGTSQQEIASASLQLTQALGAGVLRGEELNAVYEAAPNIIQTIADYLEVPIGHIKEMASEGEITATVVKNAMLGATDEINAKFNDMPMTWGQVWTGITNEFIQYSQPILSFINAMAQNWSVIEPIVLGVVAAIGAYITGLAILKGASLVSAAATTFNTLMTQGFTTAAYSAAIAQGSFNATLLASPYTWVVIGIIGIVAALYAVVAYLNKTKDTALSAFGIITGAFSTAGAAIWNILLGLGSFIISGGIEIWNFIGAFANFFANVFNNPVGAIINLFAGAFDFILGTVQAAAKLIDTVLRTDMSGAVRNFRDKVSAKVSDIVGEQVVVMEQLDANDFLKNGGIGYGEAYNKGYDWGKGAGEFVSDKLGFNNDFKASAFNFEPDAFAADLGEIAANTGEIATNTGITKEDLKYMRDLAERDVINRFTTAEIKIEQTNHNNVNSAMDIDGIVDKLATGVNDAMLIASEGVHK